MNTEEEGKEEISKRLTPKCHCADVVKFEGVKSSVTWKTCQPTQSQELSPALFTADVRPKQGLPALISRSPSQVPAK